MAPNRVRRDTRAPSRPRSVQATGAGGTLFPTDASGCPLERPPTASLKMLALRVMDPDAYRQWQEACLAWYEWRAADGRNALGLSPGLVIPVAAVAMFLLVFWWPADGNLATLAHRFGPARLVEMAREVNSGPECFGPSYKDRLCPDYAYTPEQLAAKRRMVANASVAGRALTGEQEMERHLPLMGICLMLLVGTAILRPQLLRKAFGVVDADPNLFRRKPLPTPRVEAPPAPEPVRASPPTSPGAAATPRTGFGRKVS